MAQSRVDKTRSELLTSRLLGLVYGCPNTTLNPDCPLHGVRQMDRLTTRHFLHNLCDADRLWIAARHGQCRWREAAPDLPSFCVPAATVRN